MKKAIFTGIMAMTCFAAQAQQNIVYVHDTIYVEKKCEKCENCGKKAEQGTAATSETATATTAATTNGQVPYAVAHNYFFRNDAQIPANPLITDQETFERFFGTATTMDEDGQPTPIDFENQFVIAIVKPATSVETSLQPAKLTLDDEKLDFVYNTVVGKKMSSTMQPSLILVLDREYKRPSISVSSKTKRNVQDDTDGVLRSVYD